MNDAASQPSGVPQAAQAALEYRRAIMKVRGWCAMLAFFGALVIWQSLQLLDAGVDIGGLGLLIGGTLILVAIAAAWKPSAWTMMMEAGAFAAIGAWDLSLAVLSDGEAADLAIWGLIEIGIAVYLFAKLPGFIAMAAQKPSDETLRQLDALAASIRKAKLQQEPDLIQFAVGSSTWRARLSEEVAVFLDLKQSHNMLFLTREEVGVEDRTKPGKEPKMRPVNIRAGSNTWKTKLTAEHLEALIAWTCNSATEGPMLAEPAAE